MSNTKRKGETTTERGGTNLRFDQETPGLLLAYSPSKSVGLDRLAVTCPFVVGRGETCQLSIADHNLSRQHFKIELEYDRFYIQDLGSTNETFVDGQLLDKKVLLNDGSVIRAGEIVAVFLENAAEILVAPAATTRHGIFGQFYASALQRDLNEAVHSQMHILLAGPSGTGKELAAAAIADLKREQDDLLGYVVHNCARFSSEEEAAVSLFGVAAKVFSSVDARAGVIEQAHKGVLFLDEIHNLPLRLQRTLLRVLEHGYFQRIGETRSREAQVFFVLASNVTDETYGLAHDLFNRLWTITLPALKDRVADIPGLFTLFLKKALDDRQLSWSEVSRHLEADHMETLCLADFEMSNIRGLKELAMRIATRIELGTDPKSAINSVFGQRFAGSPVLDRDHGGDPGVEPASHYEIHRVIITKVIEETAGNLSLAERRLRAEGIQCSRRWLRVYAQRWGIREIK